MCGICVSVRLDRRQRQTASDEERANLEAGLSKGLDFIAHRGPDAKGIWVNEDGSVGLGHNRLSINDLSESGNQPHHSPDNKIHAVINGEIYDPNDALRTELETVHGYHFPSHADTELVIALYTVYGAPDFLTHLRGEFSLVLYDERVPGAERIILARDRFGIKPLFYTTLFHGVQKVSPAGWVEVGVDGSIKKGWYWDMDYKDKLGNQDATKRICCFSIEFPTDDNFNEAGVDIAERTANWLGVQILKKRMDEEALAENFADSVYHCEHHNLDLNSVGKFCLSTVPREHGFKVVLTGEGSDEHFAGYPFFALDVLGEPDLAMPDTTLASDNALREDLWEKTFEGLKGVLTSRAGWFNHGIPDPETFREINNVQMPFVTQTWQATLDLFEPWVREQNAGYNWAATQLAQTQPEAREKIRNKWHTLHSSQYLWSRSLLANNLLTCLGDRTEMAHSIEARPPFLDHVLSEYVNGLPPTVKMVYTPDEKNVARKGGLPWSGSTKRVGSLFSEKWILREAGKPYITQELYDRKKHPYVAPNRWPKDGPIHNKLRGICTREAVEKLGFVSWEVVQKALETGFGDDADGTAFRKLLVVGGLVTIGERFGVKRAEFAGVNGGSGI
ncbi:nucleophile aminohydrolase [Chaetomium sp. MPI-SDFR-AT-0129]|nr:nucleophile aminohydrolase [Chaetomium sp. MPI-SDFR-AT-0129]